MVYTSGQQIVLSCVFTLSGRVADPSAVDVNVRFGTASATSYRYPSADSAVTRNSTGDYQVLFTPVSAGTYYFRFKGHTGVEAAEEGSFDCASSRF